MDYDLDLTALRVFRTVARERSFSNAARLMRVPKSTVSKRVRDLEAGLGVRLLERTTRQLRLTAEGTVLAARAERLLGEAEDIARALSASGSAPQGHLRLAVPQLFGQLFMGRIAAGFRARHPEITLDIVLLDRPPDLLEEGFDGMVRLGPLEDSGQAARRLGAVHGVLVAAPALAAGLALNEPEDLRDLPAVVPSPAAAHGWEFERIDRPEIRRRVDAAAGLAIGSYLALREAALAGAGAALLPDFLVRRDIERGRLVHLLPGWIGNRRELHFVYPSPQSATARLRAFIDHLTDDLRDNGLAAEPCAVTLPDGRD